MKLNALLILPFVAQIDFVLKGLIAKKLKYIVPGYCLHLSSFIARSRHLTHTNMFRYSLAIIFQLGLFLCSLNHNASTPSPNVACSYCLFGLTPDDGDFNARKVVIQSQSEQWPLSDTRGLRDARVGYITNSWPDIFSRVFGLV